jgi:hypothetical protein
VTEEAKLNIGKPYDMSQMGVFIIAVWGKEYQYEEQIKQEKNTFVSTFKT